MPIYHVDTFLGSDSNDGSTWALAWKTTHPLKALYTGVAVVSDLEIRIAKTVPVETNRTINFAGPQNGTHAYCAGIARTLAGYRKAVIADYPGVVARPFDWGGTIYSPFYNITESIAPAYRPAGTHKFQVSAPAGASGRALKWLVSDGAFSTFNCLEVVGAFNLPGATATLQLCSDTDGLVVLRSFPMNLGVSVYSTNLSLIGVGDLPDGVASVNIVIDNPTDSAVDAEIGAIYAVLPHTNPNYVGLRLVYVPNDKMGNALTPVSSSGLYTLFNGQDGPGIDLYRVTQGQAVRTWSTHYWTPYPYDVEPLLGSATVAGSGLAPLKVSGGWNTTTNLVDGLTALDAANLKWFNFISRVSVDIRNLVLTFRRAALSADTVGVSGIMEAERLATQRIVACHTERVYLPAGGAGVIGQEIGFYVTYYASDALLNSAMSTSTFSMKDCNTALTAPFFGSGGDHTATQIKGCTIGMTPPMVKSNTLYEDCVFLGTRTWLGGIGTIVHPPILMKNCDILSTFISNSWGNDYACAPQGTMEDCRMWGAYTGPRNAVIQHKDCEWRPLPGVLGQVCSSGANFDGLACPNGEAFLTSTTPMFARTGIDAEPVTIHLKNANIQVAFASITPQAGTYDRRGHTVTLENVTLHKTTAATGSAFLSARLKAKDITLSGAWTSLLSGIIRGADVDGVVVTDATTRLVGSYSFSGPATGHGRVSSYFRNILHPSGLTGFLGTPVARYASGAGYFQSTAGEMWATDAIKVTRDLTIAHSGASSWRAQTLLNVGAVSRGSFMLGAVPVVAGVALTFKAWLRRDSYDVLGGIFLRPLGTREFVAPGATTAATLHDIVVMQSITQTPGTWAEVTLSYTPYATGLVELHFGMRGVSGNSVWLDTLKVSQ